MSTNLGLGIPGNLEMRLYGEEPIYFSTAHDGHRVFRVINELARDLNELKGMADFEYGMFASSFAREVGLEFKKRLVGGTNVEETKCEVIIDIDRRLIIYNATDAEHQVIDPNSVRSLRENHGYQLLRFTGRSRPDYPELKPGDPGVLPLKSPDDLGS
ncbi:MAG: hypothetical protein HY512_01750 [Candidatus Aenigmarchaeota archaeon]|nr:hypothetical protein [Candidatus Aenigmarchaeota archaeon]